LFHPARNLTYRAMLRVLIVDDGRFMNMPARIVLGLLAGWSRLARRPLTVAFYATLFLICVLVVLAAPHRIHRWVHDSFFLLDGGWRVLNGQRPYVDFYATAGPVMCQIVALGLVLSRWGVQGVDYGVATVAALLGIWAWTLFKVWLERPAALVLALFVTLITVSPHTSGSRPDLLTSAGMYNRLGYAILIITLIEAVRPARLLARRTELLGGISSGVACCLLFFLKSTYFLASVALIFGACVFRNRCNRDRVLGLAIGSTVATVAMLAYLRFDVAAVWQNLRALAGARTELQADPRIDLGVRVMLTSAYDHATLGLGLLLLALVVSSLPRQPRLTFYFDTWWPMAAAAAIYVGDVFLLSTNGVQFSMPLVAAFALVLVSQIYSWSSRASAEEQHRHGLLCGIGFLLGFLLFLPEAAGDLFSLVYSSEQSLAGPLTAARFEPAHLRRMLTEEAHPDWDEPDSGKLFVDRVNDGIELLHHASAPTETVATLDKINPFSYALLRKPPRGSGPWLALNVLNEKHMPSAEWLFGQADLVMVPKDRNRIRTPLDERIRQIFLPFIDTTFHVAAESPYWFLYRRNAR
jgi:hypothetical protein